MLYFIFCLWVWFFFFCRGGGIFGFFFIFCFWADCLGFFVVVSLFLNFFGGEGWCILFVWFLLLE